MLKKDPIKVISAKIKRLHAELDQRKVLERHISASRELSNKRIKEDQKLVVDECRSYLLHKLEVLLPHSKFKRTDVKVIYSKFVQPEILNNLVEIDFRFRVLYGDEDPKRGKTFIETFNIYQCAKGLNILAREIADWVLNPDEIEGTMLNTIQGFRKLEKKRATLNRFTFKFKFPTHDFPKESKITFDPKAMMYKLKEHYMFFMVTENEVMTNDFNDTREFALLNGEHFCVAVQDKSFEDYYKVDLYYNSEAFLGIWSEAIEYYFLSDKLPE